MTGFTGAGLDRADQLRFRPEELAAVAARGDARLLDLEILDPVLDQADRLSWSGHRWQTHCGLKGLGLNP